jgi:Flp pilus assembly protein TadD
VVARVALAALCLVVAAWLALGLRDARLEQRGTELSRSPAALHDAAVARQADEQLADAELLNPDTNPVLVRGALAFRRGDLARSTSLLQDVVEHEPENLPAWRLLALVADANHDRPLAREATRRSRRLSTPAG